MEKVQQIKCFLLDLDGTVYLGGNLIDGAKEAIDRMRKQGRVVFLTNNSSLCRDDYIKKIAAYGLTVGNDDVYTSANATQDWLVENRPNSKLFIVGTDKVKQEFASRGLFEHDDADTVVLTFDKTLTYEKLVRACDLICKGAFYIATHPDMVCPMEHGSIPDVGAMIMLIEGATGRKPDIICGKPFGIMADGIAKFTGIPSSLTAMVGDRISTDIKFGADNGMTAMLVLTGEGTKADLLKSGLNATVINSLAEWDK